MENTFNILAIISGAYGLRHVARVKEHAPAHWMVKTWRAPSIFPLVIDYPEDYLPAELPPSSLILSFAEHKAIAELLPDIARMTGARAVIAAVDNEAWLPRGLARQLRGWLESMDVACATPKPLCSLTETDYLVARQQRVQYNSLQIAEFARYFGQPELQIQVDPTTCQVIAVEVLRDAACGCACFVAENLTGVSVDEAEEKAGLLHHHFPCLASMGKDADFDDTLMHISGNLLKNEINRQVKPYKTTPYISPGTRSEEA